MKVCWQNLACVCSGHRRLWCHGHPSRLARRVCARGTSASHKAYIRCLTNGRESNQVDINSVEQSYLYAQALEICIRRPRYSQDTKLEDVRTTRQSNVNLVKRVTIVRPCVTHSLPEAQPNGCDVCLGKWPPRASPSPWKRQRVKTCAAATLIQTHRGMLDELQG